MIISIIFLLGLMGLVALAAMVISFIKTRNVKILIFAGVPLLLLSGFFAGFIGYMAISKQANLFTVHYNFGSGEIEGEKFLYRSLDWIIPADSESADHFEELLVQRFGEGEVLFVDDYPWFFRENLLSENWIVEEGGFVEDYSPVYVFPRDEYTFLLMRSETMVPLPREYAKSETEFIETYSYELIVAEAEGFEDPSRRLKKSRKLIKEVIEVFFSPEIRKQYSN